MVERSPQEWLEIKNQCLREVDKFLHRWNESITLDNLRIKDRFKDGEIHIILHGLIVSTGERWGICLESPRLKQKLSPIPPFGNVDGMVPDGESVPMLIDVIQFVDSPKDVTSALVWLKPIDDFYRFWPDALYFSSLLGFVSIPVLRDGKLYASGGNGVRTCQDKMICELVESAAQIVDEVSSDRQHVKGIDGKLSITPDDAAKIRVLLRESSVSVLTPSSLHLDFEITEVLFGPFNFYANQDQSIVGGEWHRKTSNGRRPVGGIISPYEDEFRQGHAG